MKLLDLIEKIDYESYKNQNDIDYKIVTFDSRQVKEEGIFVAIKGNEMDGHDFIPQAIANGAKAIVHTEDVDYVDGISYIRVSDARIALAQISNTLSDYPSRKLRLVGVTGTNGKTTTATFIYRLFRELDGSCINIGTDGTYINDETLENAATTPEICQVNELFQKALDKGVKNAVIEASSHGLYLHRLDGVDFDYGVFTNLSLEHTDFHGSMENYFKAKMILLENSKKRIINVDDEYGKRAKEIYKDALTFSINEDSDYRALDIKNVNHKQIFYVKGQKFILNRYAIFDVYNVLAAIAILDQEGFPLDKISQAVEKLEGVKSRFEFIENDLGINLIVDFAHNPLGYENLYSSIAEGENVIAVYGVNGDRTREVREQMGECSARHGVFSVLTTDDVKFSSYEEIRDDIIKGIERENGKYIEIRDRKEAIKYAIKMAKPGDFVLVLGKGEEDYLKLKGNEKTPYSEKEAIREALESI